MTDEPEKTHRLTIFGLKVLNQNGEVVRTADAAGHTYFRNMVLEFVGRHFPEKLFEYFPNIRGPWQWGPCEDKSAFESFLADTVELKLNDDGSVAIRTKGPIEETVFHPDKEQRRIIRGTSTS